MEPEERAAAGMFLAFQYPVELPGVGNANFLRTALNALRRARGEAELDAVQFLKLARAETKRLAMPDDMLKRNVNVGFSGGEKKRNEVLQMAILRPRLAILDETDSGLDIDALKIVADGVNALRGPAFRRSSSPTTSGCSTTSCRTACMCWLRGRIVKSGGPELAHELEADGYAGWWRRRHERDCSHAARRCGWSRRRRLSVAFGGLRGAAGDVAARRRRAGFPRHGLPGPRDEAWHYTSLRAAG